MHAVSDRAYRLSPSGTWNVNGARSSALSTLRVDKSRLSPPSASPAPTGHPLLFGTGALSIVSNRPVMPSSYREQADISSDQKASPLVPVVLCRPHPKEGIGRHMLRVPRASLRLRPRPCRGYPGSVGVASIGRSHPRPAVLPQDSVSAHPVPPAPIAICPPYMLRIAKDTATDDTRSPAPPPLAGWAGCRNSPG